MKSLAQEADPNTLLMELKQLLKSPSSTSSTPSKDPAAKQSGSYSCPIHSSWHNLGDFNLSMVRHHGGTGHSGIDMSCPAGTPVYATAPGIVNRVGSNSVGGNVVGIQHGKDAWSYYAHLATIKVQEGAKVDASTVIGTVGNTGNAKASWPHLHFGIKMKGSWVNPGQFFSIPKFNQAFADNPAKFESFWTSEQAKSEALKFDVTKHKSQPKTRLASVQADNLLELVDEFYKLSIQE